MRTLEQYDRVETQPLNPELLTSDAPDVRLALTTPATDAAALAGRMLICIIFLISGSGKILNWTATEAQMTAEGIPLPVAFLTLAVVCEIAGGLGVLLGAWTRISSLVLLAFLIPTTLIFHDYWGYAGTERQMQLTHFMKNMTIMGGLLVLAAFGPGRYSVDSARLSPVASPPPPM